jgi:nicotinamidase-related amidase
MLGHLDEPGLMRAAADMQALLVVDMQVQCFAGQPPRRDADGTVQRINALARAMRQCGLVVFVYHTDADDGYAWGTDGWQLLATLERAPQDLAVEKSGCDAFLETELDALLKSRSVTDLIVVGCATDFCVDTTVRSAAARGYRVTVASDGHTTRDRPHLPADKIIEHHNYMWTDLVLPRRGRVRVADTKTLLSELMNGQPARA